MNSSRRHFVQRIFDFVDCGSRIMEKTGAKTPKEKKYEEESYQGIVIF